MSRFAPAIGAGFAVLASLVALGGCGRDEPEQAAAPAPPASTPVATSPAATTPAATTPAPDQAARDAAKEPSKSAAADEDPDAVVKADASPKTKTPTTPVGKTAAALRAAGFKPRAFGATGNATASLKVGDVAIAFYDSDAAAKEDYLTFSGAFESSQGAYGDVIHKGRRVYLLSKATALTAADKAELRKIVKVGEAAG